MRDWNSRKSRTSSTGTLFWSYLWGIEIPTPREIPFNSPGFDLTYEGLKFYCDFICRLTVGSVLILPMRDWNLPQALPARSLFEVLILPMRDWNKESFNEVVASVGVLILPMRDWNRTVENEIKRIRLVLILPMRDWNSGSLTSFIWSFLFWSYLWGIEIRISF